MIGCAFTPASRHAADNRWKTPKCSSSTIPVIATHPAANGCRGAIAAAQYINAVPTRVFPTAAVHSLGEGAGTGAATGRKAAASMPGQASRYPAARRRLIGVPRRLASR